MSVLKFVRGVDLSDTDFELGKFPTTIDQLQNMRWLRLNRTGLDVIPSAVNRLARLEHLYMEGNKLLCIPPSIKLLTSLQALRASYNDLSQNDICGDLFRLEELTTVDLSHNSMTELPADISLAANLVILSLGHNKLAGLTTDFLRHVTDLEHLDVGYNKIEMLLPQLRRLAHLRTLILSGNPLGSSSMRSIASLQDLERLELRATGRTAANLPPGLHELTNLTDLDLSENDIAELPEALTQLPALRRLNMGDNKIATLPQSVRNWTNLESLNLSRNSLTAIPEDLCHVVTLRRLFVNSNKLGENAIPAAIQQLVNLELLQASNNELTSICVNLFQCSKLSQLMLHNNHLKTLPVEVYSLKNLKDLKVNGNPGFVMPTRPPPPVDEGNEFYHIDFDAAVNMRRNLSSERISLQRLPSNSNLFKRVVSGNVSKRAGESDEQAKVLKGLKTLTENLDNKSDATGGGSDTQMEQAFGPGPAPPPMPKKWADSLTKPQLDYSDLFDESIKKKLGITVWRMENFLPAPIQTIEYGKFYEADCYIIMENRVDPDGNHIFVIHFWIGHESSLDKKASAAIHAVNLRNFLGASGSTLREEQEDESREFMKLFNNSVAYLQGGTDSGFFEVEEQIRPTRLYVLHGNLSLRSDAIPLDPQLLSSDHLYMLDAHNVLYLWKGKNVKSVVMQKGRLFLAKAVKAYATHQRSITCLEVFEGEEPADFLKALGVSHMPTSKPKTKFVPPTHPAKLHIMRLGEGYIELPQIVKAGRALDHRLLKTENVYILDVYADLYIWIGRKSSRLVRAGALRVASELQAILPRPPNCLMTRVTEGNEPQVFRSRFQTWDDVIDVDHRAADIVKVEQMKTKKLDKPMSRLSKLERGSSAISLSPSMKPSAPTPGTYLAKRNEEREQAAAAGHGAAAAAASAGDAGKASSFKTPARSIGLHSALTAESSTDDEPGGDKPLEIKIADMFAPPRPFMADEQAERLETQWAEQHEKMEAFVLQGSSFVRLPKGRLGHFWSEDCYVFMVTQWRVVEGAAGEDEGEEEMEAVAYFWQGRDAKNMGWLTFSFTTKEQMENLIRTNIGCELQVVREFQNKESMRFLCLFERKMVVHNGKYGDKAVQAQPQLFRLHTWHPPTFCRTVEVPCTANQLNSHDCFILRVPFGDGNGVVYVWSGSKASAEDALCTQEIARSEMWAPFSVQIVQEGSEPKRFFWSTLAPDAEAPSKLYDHDFDRRNVRMFLCTFKNNVFVVTEKQPDFCQDDLEDQIVAILDTGKKVYFWAGPLASNVVIKLAMKSTLEYCARVRQSRVQPEQVKKGKEPLEFTLIFPSWHKHQERAKDLSRPISYLGNVLEGTPYKSNRPSTPREKPLAKPVSILTHLD
eukprot:m.193614 g.193614  ORF g.193614 m.193614 type:complete len:1373 (+) comp17602_c1_seq5:88-4206(+)